ncbi:MAG: DUF2628 domain-containing protein [Rhodopseudomonas sp.]|uniref:DUF2628 domain-containing protein n=1 Tax=Rhodopseudomonas sp. TaxID=1078 RepID=UPI00181FDEBB|nr:DUF2628 domain-containing protein [Rhodopseudomonas sp.]NVN85913.1 DUF2628 domain-containing protein [Rhodopseudomonas sp.]
MPVYTVHAPPTVDQEPDNTSDRFVFVRDGFHGWAFLLGPVWLLYRRLWLALLGYIALNVTLTLGLSAAHADAGARLGVMFLLALLLGFEAATLWRWTLSRREWRQLDIVVAADEEAAERRFFDRWTSAQPGAVGYQFPVDRGEPPPVRRIPLPASSIYNDIVGSFPRPGSSR